MKKGVIILLAVAMIGALIFSSCKPSTTTTTTLPQTQTSISTTITVPHKVLKIGSVLALNIPMFLEQKKWYELFAKLVNENGGWKIGDDTYDVEMIIYDGQNDPALSKNYLEKMVLQDGVKFIFSSPTSNAATDTEVTEPNKVICLAGDYTDAAADPKIQYYYTPQGGVFSKGLLYDLYKDMEGKGYKTYVELKADDMVGHIFDGMCQAVWSVANPEVKYAGTVFYDSSTTDFGPIATKVMNLQPDLVDGIFTFTTQIYNAMYDAGYKGSFIPSLSPDQYAAVVTHCGKDFVEGWETGMADPRGFQKDPEMLALIDAYTKEYGTFISDGCVGTVFWFVLKDAINCTQSVDVEIIKAYLDNQPHAVKSLGGDCQLIARPDRGNLRTITGAPSSILGMVKDGELGFYRVVTVKDQYLATILCNNLVEAYKAYWDQYGYPNFSADPPSLLKFSDLGITGHD